MSIIRDIDKMASGKTAYEIAVRESMITADLIKASAKIEKEITNALASQMNDYVDQIEAKSMGGRIFASWRGDVARGDIVAYLYNVDDAWAIVVRGPDEGEFALPDELSHWADSDRRRKLASEEDARRDFAAIYLHYLTHLGEPSSQAEYPTTDINSTVPKKGDET